MTDDEVLDRAATLDEFLSEFIRDRPDLVLTITSAAGASVNIDRPVSKPGLCLIPLAPYREAARPA